MKKMKYILALAAMLLSVVSVQAFDHNGVTYMQTGAADTVTTYRGTPLIKYVDQAEGCVATLNLLYKVSSDVKLSSTNAATSLQISKIVGGAPIVETDNSEYEVYDWGVDEPAYADGALFESLNTMFLNAGRAQTYPAGKDIYYYGSLITAAQWAGYGAVDYFVYFDEKTGNFVDGYVHKYHAINKYVIKEFRSETSSTLVGVNTGAITPTVASLVIAEDAPANLFADGAFNNARGLTTISNSSAAYQVQEDDNFVLLYNADYSKLLVALEKNHTGNHSIELNANTTSLAERAMNTLSNDTLVYSNASFHAPSALGGSNNRVLNKASLVKYTATFKYEKIPGGQLYTDLSTAQYKAGETVAFPTADVPNRAGKQVVWYRTTVKDAANEVEDDSAEKMPAGDIIYVARYVEPRAPKYTITFIDANGLNEDITAKYEAGETVVFPEPADGYERFWYDEEIADFNPASGYVMPAGPATFYYLDAEAPVTVPKKVDLFIYDIAGTERYHLRDLTPGQSVDFPQPEAGFTRVWKYRTDDSEFDPLTFTMPSKATFVYYEDIELMCHVVFNVEGNGHIEGATTGNYVLGTNIEFEAVPEAGYHFVRWSDGSVTAHRINVSVTEDITYTAYFEQNPVQYTASFGHLSPKGKFVEDSNATYEAGQAVRFPDIAVEQGQVVTWFDNDDDSEVDPETYNMPAADKEFYYEITTPEPPKQEYTITFYLQTPATAGSKKPKFTETSMQLEEGAAIPFPPMTPVAGFITNWYEGDEEEIPTTITTMPGYDCEFTCYYEEGIPDPYPVVPEITSVMVTETLISAERTGLTISVDADKSIDEFVLSRYLQTRLDLKKIVYIDLTNCRFSGFERIHMDLTWLNPNCLFYLDADKKFNRNGEVGYIDGENFVYRKTNDVTGDVEFKATEIVIHEKQPFYNKYKIDNVTNAEYRTTTFSATQWSFVLIPFDVKVSGDNGQDFYVARFNEYDAAEWSFDFKAVTSDLDANMPYAIKLKKGKTYSGNIHASNTWMPVSAATHSVEQEDIAGSGKKAYFEGVLERTYIDGRYPYTGVGTDNNYYYLMAGTTAQYAYNGYIGATRAYIRIPGGNLDAQDVPAIFTFETEEDEFETIIPALEPVDGGGVDGITTDLEDIIIMHQNATSSSASAIYDNRIYSIDGKFVGMDKSNLAAGVYMLNGEKFIVR